jgi:hypothetical protein
MIVHVLTSGWFLPDGPLGTRDDLHHLGHAHIGPHFFRAFPDAYPAYAGNAHYGTSALAHPGLGHFDIHDGFSFSHHSGCSTSRGQQQLQAAQCSFTGLPHVRHLGGFGLLAGQVFLMAMVRSMRRAR